MMLRLIKIQKKNGCYTPAYVNGKLIYSIHSHRVGDMTIVLKSEKRQQTQNQKDHLSCKIMSY